MQGEIHHAKDLGTAIREIRTRHGISQQELADRLGTTQRYVSELERGLPKVLDDRYLGVLSKLGIRLIYEVTE